MDTKKQSTTVEKNKDSNLYRCIDIEKEAKELIERFRTCSKIPINPLEVED